MPRKEKNKKLKTKLKPKQKQKQKQKQTQNINIHIDQSKKTNPRQPGQQQPKPPSYTGPNIVYTPSPIIQQPNQQIQPNQQPIQQPPAQNNSLDTDKLIEAFKSGSNNNINTLTDAMRNNTNYLANGISGTTSYLNDNLEQQGKYIENHLNNLFQKFYTSKPEQEIKPGTILVDDKGIGHSTFKKDSYKTPIRQTRQIEEPYQLTPSFRTISDNLLKTSQNRMTELNQLQNDIRDILGENEFKTILEMGQTPKKSPSSIQKALDKATEETKIDEPIMDFVDPSPKQEKQTIRKTEPEVVEDVRRWNYSNDTEVKLDKTNKLICNICGNTYTDAQNLKEHIRKHHTTDNPDQEYIKITKGPTNYRREYEAFLPTQLKQYKKNIDAYRKEVYQNKKVQ